MKHVIVRPPANKLINTRKVITPPRSVKNVTRLTTPKKETPKLKLSYINIPPPEKPKPIYVDKSHYESLRLLRSLDRTLAKQTPAVLIKQLEESTKTTDDKKNDILERFEVQVQNIIGFNCKYCHSTNLYGIYDDPVKGNPLKMYVTCLECGSRFIQVR